MRAVLFLVNGFPQKMDTQQCCGRKTGLPAPSSRFRTARPYLIGTSEKVSHPPASTTSACPARIFSAPEQIACDALMHACDTVCDGTVLGMPVRPQIDGLRQSIFPMKSYTSCNVSFVNVVRQCFAETYFGGNPREIIAGECDNMYGRTGMPAPSAASRAMLLVRTSWMTEPHL